AGWSSGASSSGGSSSGGGTNPLCSAKSSCANDPAPAQSAIDTCNAAFSDSSCGTKFEAFQTCATKNRGCTSGGKTDALKTAAACKNEAKDYTTCKGPVDAGKSG